MGGRAFDMDKDQTISFPETLRTFNIGLGWDTKTDIDCSVILMNKRGRPHEMVYYASKKSKNGAVIHLGDNKTGKGKGDDETI